ncbi:efflux RND transporter periplasmic adaptor subunit [Caulobacter sp. NIBR1757]|uniref:efflux RND transporter periplasmic adaptor subunit n=1 Tax=Caulobacter sp. NIBR1757 TaxID=3016000 RepID=UPI0022F13DA4|nr:efflux RND transporter periplasmic adaptor subunit [Caulobacter sp. NIBR1757]WGM38544.1 Multidrug resistance protein MexA [Caulobacter sp. NIBR1757]
MRQRSPRDTRPRTSSIQAGAIALTLAAMALSGCGDGNANAQNGFGGPAQVGVLVARAEPVTLTTELQGRTSAVLVSEVRPQVGGIIKSRHFVEGGLVRAGQLLYQIDPATYQAAYDSARAGLAQAEAARDSAKLKADRYGALAATGAVSKQDNDDAQSAFKQAQANVAFQKAAVDTARINLNFTRVTAPISGRIGKSSVTPGALVTASQVAPLATVQKMDAVYVDLSQSSTDLLKLRARLSSGQLDQSGTTAVKLILEDGSEYPIEGRLAFSDVTVDAGTGSIGLRAVFANPQGTLLPGMYVRARLTTGVAADAILVPQTAVTRDPKGGASVLVVGADNKAQTRAVTADQTKGDKWVVTAGLKPGDKVIVEGLQSVQPGGDVRVAQAGAPAQAAAGKR